MAAGRLTVPNFIAIDFETRSRVDLRTAGVYRYAEDASTDVWCAAYTINGGPMRSWVLGQVAPKDLSEAVRAGYFIRAWNAQFERLIWRDVWGPKHGVPVPNDDRYVCSMVLASAAGLPASLEEAAIVLDLATKKDMEGRRLMLQMSQPRRIEPDGTVVWWTDRAKVKRLVEYCATDVVVESAIWPLLPPAMDRRERRIYLLDQRINDRGIRLDRDLIVNARAMATTEAARLNNAIADATDGMVATVNKIVDLKAWVTAHLGRPVETLDKAAIEALCADATVPEHVRHVLDLRAAGAKSSVKKLDAMRRVACADWRARGLLRYYGAGTGRWAGRLIQPQNFPRGSVKITEDVVAALLAQDLDAVEAHGPVMEVVSSSLRGCLVADPGEALYVADFAQIEARVVAWLAGQSDLLELFASGGKVYEAMAAVIFGVPMDEVTAEMRQVGKAAVLGCFGAETLVLTQDRGWVRLADVELTDRVWDGEEWVAHGGLVYQGVKEVWQWNGIAVTPDHLVWCGDDFRPVEVVASAGNTTHLQSALDVARTPWSGGVSGHGAAFGDTCAGAIAARSTLSTRRHGTGGRRGGVGAARGGSRRAPVFGTGGTRMWSLIQRTGHACSRAFQRAFPGATTPRMLGTGGTEGGASSSGRGGGKIAARFWSTLSRWTGGMIPCLSWTGAMWTGGTNRGTFGSWTGRLMRATAGPSIGSSSASRIWKRSLPVYDLANCGPRNRFTILTDAGPLVVHNCGFQMGPRRFAESAGVDLDLAERAVAAYREQNYRIKQLWFATQDTAIAAVQRQSATPLAVRGTSKKLTFRLHGDWLAMGLPSGRSLWYHRPRIVERETPWGETRPAVEVDVQNGQTRKWEAQMMYGGLWTENATQAVARDLMADALFRVEAEGFAVRLTVHDEVIASSEPGRDVAGFVDVLSAVPAWAAGCPVMAEGWTGARYRK